MVRVGRHTMDAKLYNLMMLEGGVGTSLLLHQGLSMLIKDVSIGCEYPTFNTLVVYELKESQFTTRHGFRITVKDTNRCLVNSCLLYGICGDFLSFYHAGGYGRKQSFRLKIHGSANERIDGMVAVRDWLLLYPTEQSLVDFYLTHVRAEYEWRQAESEREQQKKVENWLGRPLSSFKRGDVALAVKAFLAGKGKRGTRKFMNRDDLLLEMYRLFPFDREVFKKMLLEREGFIFNPKILPADVLLTIASFVGTNKRTTTMIKKQGRNINLIGNC